VSRKCSICEREFAASYELNRHYTTVCPECRAIDEPRMKKETAQIAEPENGRTNLTAGEHDQ